MDTAGKERYVRSDGLVTRVVGGETTTIWDAVAAPATVAEIAQRVCRDYEVTEEAAAADVREFLDSLIQAGLVKELNG